MKRKSKSKEKANLIQLTLSALNKKGLVFACFLLIGLIFTGVSFWQILRENRPKSYSNVVEDEKSRLSLGLLSEQKTMTEFSYNTYRDIAYERTKDVFIFQMIFGESCGRPNIYKFYAWRNNPLSFDELDYVMKADLLEVEHRQHRQEKREELNKNLSDDERKKIKKKLELDEYQRDYNHLRKKDYYSE